jgi:hypothetical protein
MKKERIKRLEKISETANLDLKMLPCNCAGSSEELLDYVIKSHKVDERISKLEELMSKGHINDKENIIIEIEFLFRVLEYTQEIDHRAEAHKALEAHNLLAEGDRQTINPLVEDIKRYRQRIQRRGEKFNADQICKECGGGCCGREIEREFSAMDFFYMFYVTSVEQREEIWQMLNLPDEAGGSCRFKGKHACILPKEAVPNLCHAFYCEDIPVIGETKADDLRNKKIKRKLEKLQSMIKKIGFDLA